MAEIYPAPHSAGMMQSSSAKIDRTTAEVVGGASVVAALCGLGAVVLGVIGLAGMMPFTLCSIAVLVAGAALLIEGGAIAARISNVRAAIAVTEGRSAETEAEAGVTVEMVGGIGAIVLGILALIGMAPVTLLPAAAIVMGATLVLGSGGTYATIELPTHIDSATLAPHLSRKTAAATSGVDVLIGIAAITLGILGVITGHVTPILSLIAVLAIGAAELLTDSTMAARMATIFKHR